MVDEKEKKKSMAYSELLQTKKITVRPASGNAQNLKALSAMYICEALQKQIGRIP